MSASKRPSTSSLRRFITSRPYITVAELRRRFGLEDPDGIARLERNGTHAWIGLPEREAAKIQELWQRDELGLELSVEVRAPVVVGVYPMRIARYVIDSLPAGPTNGYPASPAGNGAAPGGVIDARLPRSTVRAPGPVGPPRPPQPATLPPFQARPSSSE